MITALLYLIIVIIEGVTAVLSAFSVVAFIIMAFACKSLINFFKKKSRNSHSKNFRALVFLPTKEIKYIDYYTADSVIRAWHKNLKRDWNKNLKEVRLESCYSECDTIIKYDVPQYIWSKYEPATKEDIDSIFFFC